ncbi:MAG: amidohydrolase [Phycisphaerales bacterium]|nr:amidohydrolase [Phycisphaerales bacterium]
MSENLAAAAREIDENLRTWRRHLHAHPELSGCEEQTARYIAGALRAMGYEPQERINGTHGLMATLRVNDDAPVVALRADIDALPITEENTVEYASRNPGVMHACGHDAHAAMLLGAAKLLMAGKARLKRSVRLVFQPHEESFPGGAPDMIAGGALAGASSIFGIHISSMLPTGQVGTRVGPFMAAVNGLKIRIIGKGGHAAMPDLAIDPVVTAANVIVALQTIVSRTVTPSEPAVVTVTQIHAGTADNVIPNEVELGGTIRTFSSQVRTTVCRRVKEIAESVAAAHGAKAVVDTRDGYPVLVNDRQTTDAALAAARDIGFNDDRIVALAPIGGGEDFAYYAEKIPASFVFLGAASEARECVYPHHHPRFNVDEDALAHGAALYAQYAFNAGAAGR